MEARKKYVIYEFNQVMGSSKHLALQKSELKGFDFNDFETEADAIKYLLDNEMAYENYVILPTVYIN